MAIDIRVAAWRRRGSTGALRSSAPPGRCCDRRRRTLDTIHFRRLHPADAALLDRVAAGVFDDPVVPARVAAYLADPTNLMVLALDGDLVVGRAAAAVHRHVDKPADLYLDELTVAATHRRRGLARRLVAEVTRWAAERGCADCWLAAEAGNVTAQALYATLGAAKPCILYYWPLAEA